MDTLLQNIKKSRDIRETTLSIYKNMLNRLSKELDVDFSNKLSIVIIYV